MLRRREHAPGLVCRGVDVAELADGLAAVQQAVRHGDDVVIAARAEHAVDLRHLLQDLVLIALRQAACHEQSADAALLLQRAHGENVVDGLALGRVDKAAGVDDHEIRAVHILLQGVACLLQAIEHLFCVDLIFGTAKGDHSHSFAHRGCTSFLIPPENPGRNVRARGGYRPTHGRGAAARLPCTARETAGSSPKSRGARTRPKLPWGSRTQEG